MMNKEKWEVRKLGEVCDVEYGTRVVRKRDGGAIYPVYGGGGATFYMDTYNREDALVVSRFAMSEQCTRYVEGKFFLNDSGLTVKTKDETKMLQSFLNMQIFHLNDYIYSLSRGAAQRNLNVPSFRKMKIVYPKSLSEQQRIVSLLDEAFEAIDQAKANAKKNLENARELFAVGLNKQFEFRNKNWTVRKLGDICKFVRGPFGGSLKKEIFKSSGYAVYEQQHAIYNQFENIRYFVDDTKFKEMERFQVKEGDIIMSCSGTIGKTAIVPNNMKKGIINQALLKITTGKDISNEFLKIWMESDAFQNQLLSGVGGAAIQNVASVKTLKQITIALPEIKEQESIVKHINKFSAETENLEAVYQQQIDNLEELRKSILEKTFNGEL